MPTRISFLQPSWISSSKTIVAPGQPIPVPCTETGLPFQVPVKPSRPRSAFRWTRLVEVRLGDVLGPQRVAGKEDGLGVVAGLGADVDRHGAEP